MGLKMRIATYGVILGVLTALGIAIYYGIYCANDEWNRGALDAQCVPTGYAFVEIICDEAGTGCVRADLRVTYSAQNVSHNGTIPSVWVGGAVAEVEEWLSRNFPVGRGFSCVYSAADPATVRLERRPTTAWFVLSISIFAAATALLGVAVAREWHRRLHR